MLNIGTDKALEKIRKFCAYRERNHREVREKLYSYGLYSNQVEEVLSVLIAGDYCNEERYAVAFAGGKFRINGWGKNKIKQALKFQEVSEYCIRKAMRGLEDEDYRKKMKMLFDRKWSSLRHEKNRLVRMKKTRDYLLQKGYETSLIHEMFETLA